MAALQQPVGGLPFDTAASRRSFADVLAAKPSPASQPASHPYDEEPLKLGLHKGQPAAFFTDAQLHGLSGQYSWSLVGKFSQGFNKSDPKKGRPSLDNLHRYFLSLDFKGEFSLGLLDNRHVIIHLSNEIDYLRLYSRMVWYIGSVTMRVFRWSPYFRVDKESPLVPVWITMPRLPIMLFEKRTLFSLASLLGQPLRCDDATTGLKRPSVARIQVELDLLKPRPDQIWIGLGEHDGYWQKIEYEFLPDYCQHCWHVGHSEDSCRVQHPELQVAASQKKMQPRLAYVPKIPQPQVSQDSPAPSSDVPSTSQQQKSTLLKPLSVNSVSALPFVSTEVSLPVVAISESPSAAQLISPIPTSSAFDSIHSSDSIRLSPLVAVHLSSQNPTPLAGVVAAQASPAVPLDVTGVANPVDVPVAGAGLPATPVDPSAVGLRTVLDSASDSAVDEVFLIEDGSVSTLLSDINLAVSGLPQPVCEKATDASNPSHQPLTTASQSSGLTDIQKASIPVDTIATVVQLYTLPAVDSAVALTGSTVPMPDTATSIDHMRAHATVAVDVATVDATVVGSEPLISKEVGFSPQPVTSDGAIVMLDSIAQFSLDRTFDFRPELLQSSGLTETNKAIVPVDIIAHPVTPMIENIDGMSSDDDVSQYPFLLPVLITDDTVLYRRKLHAAVVNARSASTKVFIDKPRAELLAEFEAFNACMRSKAVKDLAQIPVSQDTLPVDDTLTDINVEDGDFADGFITVRPKKRGRGRPRKHKK